ncbi:hypothetical protein E2C01_062036 [Portunus trituberculatus]|uniref:Uncharacterized protein n=1 Tax=Portunus trituberculatus TaxID=210409 RepID=A0A5B7H6V4_PORTR|nr:hypothetical protein [Portunus trituberculatus]
MTRYFKLYSQQFQHLWRGEALQRMGVGVRLAPSARHCLHLHAICPPLPPLPRHLPVTKHPQFLNTSTQHYLTFKRTSNQINLFSTMTRFHIHSAYYLVILYSFRNSWGGLK